MKTTEIPQSILDLHAAEVRQEVKDLVEFLGALSKMKKKPKSNDRRNSKR
jgi:hypothetical protein